MTMNGKERIHTSSHSPPLCETCMRILMLLALVCVIGCARSAVRESTDYNPAADPKSELRQLEDRLGV